MKKFIKISTDSLCLKSILWICYKRLKDWTFWRTRYYGDQEHRWKTQCGRLSFHLIVALIISSKLNNISIIISYKLINEICVIIDSIDSVRFFWRSLSKKIHFLIGRPISRKPNNLGNKENKLRQKDATFIYESEFTNAHFNNIFFFQVSDLVKNAKKWRGTWNTHVGKYDRADDRPKLAMLAANVGYRYWTDDRSRLGW